MNDISYTNWNARSDVSLTKTIGAFIKHHRIKQNKTQDDVAKAASISRSTYICTQTIFKRKGMGAFCFVKLNSKT